jgi:hypothetical protein
MIKKFKELSLNVRLFIILTILLITGIILRWNYIKYEASRSFNFFSKDKDTVTINK